MSISLGVPWMIEGGPTGAQHSASLGRGVSYAAFQGSEGVIDPLHLRVQALEVEGGQVRVAPGAIAIRNRAPNAGLQTYFAELPVEGLLDIPPNTASTTRHDLIIARVENPYVTGEGWPAPSNAAIGPYAYIRHLPNVDPNTTSIKQIRPGDSAADISKLIIPGTTEAIQGGYIVDLRSLADIGGTRIIQSNSGSTPPPIAQSVWTQATHALSGSTLLSTHNTFRDWPIEADWNVPIPSWARQVDVLLLMNPLQEVGRVWGELRLLAEGISGGTAPFDTNWGDTGGGGLRSVIMLAGSLDIISSARGKVVRVRVQGRQIASEMVTGRLIANNGTFVSAQFTFKRYPAYN